ncbi:MAG: lysophospholipase [Nanoarchaeota archaeon]|nr:lysophospholipase [Nanoarchaeota archaeon]
MEEKLFFKNKDDLELCGVLTEPKEKTDNCIVLCHGISVDKNEYANVFGNLAKKLSKKGLSVFRFDFRGHGESEGDSVDITVMGEERDLEAAIRFLKSKGYSSFGILAASFAGGAASFFVPEHQDIVKALVFWNPSLKYDKFFDPKLPWQKKYFGEPAIQRITEQGFTKIGSSGFKVGKALFDEVRCLKPWKELEKIKIPVLFIHGDKDSYVDYNDSVKYSKLPKNSSLKTIKNAEHGFHDNGPDEEEADNLTINFFLENL